MPPQRPRKMERKKGRHQTTRAGNGYVYVVQKRCEERSRLPKPYGPESCCAENHVLGVRSSCASNLPTLFLNINGSRRSQDGGSSVHGSSSSICETQTATEEKLRFRYLATGVDMESARSLRTWYSYYGDEAFSG